MRIWRSILAAAIAAPLAIGAITSLAGSARAETQGIVAVASGLQVSGKSQRGKVHSNAPALFGASS